MQPYGLATFESLRESAPARCCDFDALDLHQIACGENLEDYGIELLDGNQLDHFFLSFHWWIQVAKAIANGRDPEFRADVPDAAFQGTFPRLVQNVLSAYPAALQDTADFAGPEQDIKQKAALELFRRYWHLTEAVRAKAREIWPEVDFAWLWAQP